MENPENKLEGRELNMNAGRALVAIVLAILIATSGYSLFRLSNESQQRAELMRTNQTLQSSLDQARIELRAAADRMAAAENRTQTTQLDAPIVPSAPATQIAPEGPAPAKPMLHVKKASGKRQGAGAQQANDPRWKEVDAKLAEQQKQIEGTKSDIEKTRADLEGSLGSTRDELNGPIAKTHDEVVELRKRGERNYYEFDISKSTEFARTGPVSLSLRKANVKRKYYDIALIVDDQKIEKKHVNVYEPLWVSVPGHLEPVHVVVNSITKDNVKGYLSESKYKKSELASSAGSTTSHPAAPQPAATLAGKGFKEPLEQQ